MDMSLVYLAGTVVSMGAMDVIAFRDKPHSNTKFILAGMCFLGCFAGTLCTIKNDSLKISKSPEVSAKSSANEKVKQIQNEDKPIQVKVQSASAEQAVSFRLRQRNESHVRV